MGEEKTTKEFSGVNRGKALSLIDGMTEKQKEEALLIVSGVKRGNGTTKKVNEYIENISPKMVLRMEELSSQEENMTVSYNATRDLLDRAGVGLGMGGKGYGHGFDSANIPIGEDEAILILKRRIKIDA